MPLGAPFGKAYDAAYEVLQHIVDLSKKAAEQAKQLILLQQIKRRRVVMPVKN